MTPITGNILITGGAGFLGRGIMRRAHREGWNAKFTIFSRDERKQYDCRQQYPGARFVLGDVCDAPRLSLAMLGHDTVIHAAALKYIPEGELNADECVRVNIDGARSVIEAARAANVAHVVGISTDKAAQPVNVYGMTKAVMERLFAEAADQTYTKFTTCRYGNVIGSTGSVVPVMRSQFQRTGQVQITDTYMTRFWMSVDDAVDTICRAVEAIPGSVTVPDPRASSMHGIAYAVLGSLGEVMHPHDGDIKDDPRIRIVGKRPGEKQHEDLISHYEMFRTRCRDGYFEMLPSGNEDYSMDMPTLSSNNARMLDRETLRDMILEAMDV